MGKWSNGQMAKLPNEGSKAISDLRFEISKQTA
jgi:hypothetical protein